LKEKFLQAQTETRQREAELVALCSDEPPDPSGRWRPQDHLTHLASGREFEAGLIEAVSSGGEVPPDRQDGQNDVEYLATRDQPPAEVVARAARSWDRLESAIQAATEEDLAQARPYEPNRRRFVDLAPGDHAAAHIFWAHLDAGNEPAAEAILRWAQDLSARTSTDPRNHAVGVYNLACFYARTERVDEALPLLRESFEAAPDLKDWAHKDPDLEPIRDDPRVKELLA